MLHRRSPHLLIVDDAFALALDRVLSVQVPAEPSHPTLSHTRSAMPSQDGPLPHARCGTGCDGEGHNAAHRNGIAEHLRIVVTLITTPITTNGSCCDMPTLCAYLPVHRLSDVRSGLARPRCVSMQDSEARWRVVAYRPTYLSHVGTPYVNMRVYMSRFSASLSTS
jgi:hypothetical protein